jgi:hypothetical protein
MSEVFLRRYTDLPALVYLLTEHKITLLDPTSWDDQNDAYYLALYKQKKGLSSLLALCFTQAPETYHHWRVFANGPSGVCVRFKRSPLIATVRSHRGITAKPVTYRMLSEVRAVRPRIADLPFLKRVGFADEDEFRVVYESTSEDRTTLDLPIGLRCIDRVVLSPWMHPALVSHVKTAMRAIDGCARLNIVRSTLVGNEEWKRVGHNAG